jgi:hypothetical protein
MQDKPVTLLSRRSVLAALSIGIAFSGAGCVPAGLSADGSPFPQAFSGFAVDVSALKAKQLGPFADLIGAAALDELQRSFADRVDPRGPRLVLRVTSVFFTPFPDSSTGRLGRGGGDRGGGGSGHDAMEGEALAIGRRGEVLAVHPMLAVRDVNTSILTPNEQGRAVVLAQHYVRWLRRRI